MNKLKRIAVWMLTVFALLSAILPAAAAKGNVTYSGDAGGFIFQPGSDRSVTDLFPDFKDVMPGDTLTQPITVRNDASNHVHVKVYLRALGAQQDGASGAFLSQLTLKVRAGESLLFDAPADQTAQLNDWVLLGRLQSGGSVELDVELNVPATMDNRFMDAVGYLDWQFMVEEFPVDDPDQPFDPDQPGDPSKPDVPKTGDTINVGLFAGLFVGSGALLLVLLCLLLKKKEKKSDE